MAFLLSMFKKAKIESPEPRVLRRNFHPKDKGKDKITPITHNAMIDIETLSTKPNASIFSIACVIFNTDEKKIDKFFIDKIRINVSLFEQSQLGLDIDQDTCNFWLCSDEKLEIFDLLTKDAVPLKDALEVLSSFIKNHNVSRVWANSPTFDAIILENAYRACGIGEKIPWKFWQLMDVRTVSNLSLRKMKGYQYKDEKTRFNQEILEFDKTTLSNHDPLYDCYLQILIIQNQLLIDEKIKGYDS